MVVPFLQGMIILCPYPYSEDFNQGKARPAVVISKDGNSDELIIAKITSQLKKDKHSFFLKDEYLSEKLPKPSEIRCNNIFTIHRNQIIKSISYIKDGPAMAELLNKVKSYISD